MHRPLQEINRNYVKAITVVIVVLVVVVGYFILSRLLNLAFSASLGLLCMPHPGAGPLVYRPFRGTAEGVDLVVYLESRPSSCRPSTAKFNFS